MAQPGRDAALPAWYYAPRPLPGGAPRAGEATRLCPADSTALEQRYNALKAPLRTGPPPPPPREPQLAPSGPVVRSGLWEADAQLRWLGPCYRSDAPRGEPRGAFASAFGATDATSATSEAGSHEEAADRGSAEPGASRPTSALRDGAAAVLVRATWFVDVKGDLLPVAEPLAAMLEHAYRAAAGAPGRTTLGGPAVGPSGGPLLAVFGADGDAWLVPDGLATKLSAAMQASAGPVLGSAGSLPPAPGAQRLRRGFSEAHAAPLGEDESGDAKAAAAGEVTHLVLTTHGIGHALDFVSHAASAGVVRDVMRRLPGGLMDGLAGRLLVLPVQWRKGLQLTGDDGALDALLPDAQALRQVREEGVCTCPACVC